ncbi:MAG: hypothetical protein LAO05_11400 [Acidobacteriia bacterium]|nr:hypothetical protein [Terriglobia bacterium]
MKPYRLALIVLFVVAVTGLVGCSNNNSAKTEADVYLSEAVQPGPAEVSVSSGADVIIPTLTISSHPKNAGASLTQQEDVILNQWVVTCTRTDGGTVASPQWTNFYQVYVPAGGSTSLSNYRIFPSEYFLQPPLNQLLVSPFLDAETNNPFIRQRLHIAIYGKEVSGKNISLEFDVNLKFMF